MSLYFSWLTLQWLIIGSVLAQDDGFLYDTFPEDFLWGLATSAYQIEGGYKIDGKGLSIWDTWTHENDGEHIKDRSNGDVACDSYNKYLEDVQLLKNMGAKFYRFSISWTRVLPNGLSNDTVNPAGIAYYNKLINALLENGITPFITMFHWDLPQTLQDKEGWLNEELAYEFAHYARVLYTEFGDRVKDWITFNEPWVFCQLGYGYGSTAPGVSGIEEKPYQCAHTVIKSHGLAYRIYENEFKDQQKGQVGITLNSNWAEPKDPMNSSHVEASDRSLRFNLGWFANPLYRGDYHPIMRQLIDEKSEAEGRNVSRLPVFDEEWKNIINGTLDFIGINHYSSVYIFPNYDGSPGLDGDSNCGSEHDPEWEETAAPWLRIVPWGFRKLVNWITKEYNRLPIYITENGSADRDINGANDDQRTRYYKSYINELLKAVKLDNASVKAYAAWSLMDNYEWDDGFTLRFGVHYVNFSDPNLTRIPKDSGILLKQIFGDNGFPNTTINL